MNLGGLSGKGGMKDINVTPLIDVVLVMLIIFMVITPIMINEMAVNLPEKTETVEQEDMPKQQVVVAVCEDGTVALNRQIMNMETLAVKVAQRLRSKSKKVVFVDGHPEAPYDRMVELMDAVRNAGADKIGLASLKTPEEFRACTAAAAAPPPPAAPEAPAG